MDLCTWKALTAAIAAQGPVANFFLSIFPSLSVSHIYVRLTYDIFKAVTVSVAAGHVNLFY